MSRRRRSHTTCYRGRSHIQLTASCARAYGRGDTRKHTALEVRRPRTAKPRAMPGPSVAAITRAALALGRKQAKQARAHVREGESDGRVPRAILLSGGGNDIAGGELGVLLNHATTAPPLDEINEAVVAGIIDQRLRFAMVSLIGARDRAREDAFRQGDPGRHPRVWLPGARRPRLPGQASGSCPARGWSPGSGRRATSPGTAWTFRAAPRS